MSIFGSILNSIFHHSTSAPAQASASSGGAQQTQTNTAASTASQAQPGAGTMPPPMAGGSQKLQSVDVEAVLTQLASKKGGGSNWRTSIVDLLKLLDLDSSLSARKELANELNVHAGADGSAEQNVALQKAVMAKLAENGGKVPESLRH
jgi:hypothetical protein